MNNLPKLDDIKNMNDSEIITLPIDIIYALYKECEEKSTLIKDLKSKLNSAIISKYNDKLDTNNIGTVNIQDCGFNIKVTVDKNVSWHQDKLKVVKDIIKDNWNGNPDEYIDTKLSVSEAKFKAWPKDTQKLFLDARTVKPSSPKIEIKEI